MSRKWADDWTRGFGLLRRDPATIERIAVLVERLVQRGVWPDPESVYRVLAAADRLTRAAMWLVVHMTYARRVDLSGAPLPEEAFKDDPEGHTGGSLNMVPAFVGYLTANVLSGATRSWVMGQGHCVAAIEAVNVLTGDVSDVERTRYPRTEAGLSQLVSDFYGYQIRPDGRPAAPLGSHLGPTTAGAVAEGGYLGFAELQYVHMPLRGESLVAFLSDGAFEEQRGSDWAPRWWRAEDCGLATPVMILNGRRIEERSEIEQEGGATWLECHLSMSGFDPMVIDGHDPAAFAWAILEAEERVKRFTADPERRYPAPLPYVIARAVKGFGFPGAGTNRAHNLPLEGNPRQDAIARDTFNAASASLFVPKRELAAAIDVLRTHDVQHRPLESRHAAATRNPPALCAPPPAWTEVAASPMDALDAWVVGLVDANPGLRPRVGNPDELRSNHMGRTLDRLKHRVNRPEPGAAEAIDGAVITALNEEAVCGAALGNKGGLNLIISYEAFAVKMLGALRQEIVFARRQKEVGVPPQWISIPLIATSHTWENSKNEQSHQDPTLVEALLGEMSDTARVLFPIDANSAVAGLAEVYRTRGEIACLVVPKRPLPALLAGPIAMEFATRGWGHLAGDPAEADVQIVAVGAYQAIEALEACNRLQARGHRACVTAVLEPGRLRAPRDSLEAAATLGEAALNSAFPPDLPRVLVTHTRPEPMQGLLRRIDPGRDRMLSLGYIGRGGTLDVFGMLFANRCTWGHIVDAAAKVMKAPLSDLLDPCEATAVAGKTNPRALQASLG
ncbi:phosphoketolase family protein [Phenylobacterium soli]|uniref:xylulose 5-phosphate 3-epimerase n=1 Tax=Phenylobacterium soli TaxID=2170551 RepID=UPI001D04AA88